MEDSTLYHEIYNFNFLPNSSDLFLGSQIDGEYRSGNGVKSAWIDKLIDVVIPSYVNGKKVVVLGYKCFREVPNIQTAFIPRTIKSIEGDTFLGCTKLTTVTFEDNSELEFIDRYNFYQTNLCSITFPPSLRMITGDQMFTSCPLL